MVGFCLVCSNNTLLGWLPASCITILCWMSAAAAAYVFLYLTCIYKSRKQHSLQHLSVLCLLHLAHRLIINLLACHCHCLSSKFLAGHSEHQPAPTWRITAPTHLNSLLLFFLFILYYSELIIKKKQNSFVTQNSRVCISVSGWHDPTLALSKSHYWFTAPCTHSCTPGCPTFLDLLDSGSINTLAVLQYSPTPMCKRLWKPTVGMHS